MANVMTCPDCGVSVSLTVDGKPMTEYELLHLRRAPKSIERRMYHNLRCPRTEERWRKD